MKSYGKIPGPFGLPIVGNLFSFASFTPKAHLTWTAWAKTFGKIYKYVPISCIRSSEDCYLRDGNACGTTCAQASMH